VSCAQVSRERIYVAATTYEYNLVARGLPEPTEDLPKPSRGVWSAIMTFDINSGEPTFGGIAEVEGSIINQFAMDEHQGYLRVATTRGEMWASPPTSESGITVLDQDLAQVGLLEGLAPGERIYSVRFMGARGYVVTYRQVDPFFVFDLSRPESPMTLGYLKIPGFSDYLHPLVGNYMLGVGKDTEEVETGRVITKGVKLSLFNVNDPENPTEEAVLVLGDGGSSTEVSYQHKAFLYHPGTGVISLPVDLHQAERCKEERTPGGACPGFTEWAPTTFQGAYVLYLEGDDTKSFRVHGRITHEHLSGTSNNPSDTSRVMWGLWGGWGWRSSLRRVYRSIFMDGLLYTLSDRHMQVCFFVCLSVSVCTSGLIVLSWALLRRLPYPVMLLQCRCTIW
jgi:inhibitor of cysteine peptidase